MLTDDEIHGIAEAIRKGKATFVGRQSLNVTIWKVVVQDRQVAVVYDRKRKTIRTVMPTDFVEGCKT